MAQILGALICMDSGLKHSVRVDKIDSTDAARVFSWRADDFASVALQIQPVNTFIGKQKEWLLELPTFLNRLYQSTWPDGCANLSLRVAKLFVCT